MRCQRKIIPTPSLEDMVHKALLEMFPVCCPEDFYMPITARDVLPRLPISPDPALSSITRAMHRLEAAGKIKLMDLGYRSLAYNIPRSAPGEKGERA